MSISENVVYFEKPGRENSEQTLRLAVNAAKALGIKYIAMASSTGTTALLMPECEGISVSVVHTTYKNGKCRMTDENRSTLEKRGFKVFTGGHALSGVERSLSGKLGGVYPIEIMAYTLRMFGQGTKVAVEVAAMAVDAGFIPEGESIIAIGGTAGGADTAIVMRAAQSALLLDSKIDRYICKPII